MGFARVQLTYYLIALVLMLWMMWRYRQSLFLLLLLLLAFNGPLSYFLPSGPQIMRVVTTILATYLLLKYNVFKHWEQLKGLVIVFVFLSIYFFYVSLIKWQGGLLFTFGQYSKYYVPFACYLLFAVWMVKYPQSLEYINVFFRELIYIQILSGVLKAIMLNMHFWEGMVGTFGQPQGGGAGTSFPLVALAWVCVNTNMNIKGWRSWAFLAGLLLIGIMTGKRAVVVLFPLFFVIFALYVARKKYPKMVMAVIVLAPLLFYFGLRLTPSLNPENKVWGSFDIEYALNYGKYYSMGETDQYGNREKGVGRVGATLLMWDWIKDVDNYDIHSWIGHGVERIYKSNDYEHYYDKDYNFGINHRGSMTGIVMWYLAFGLIGLILFMLYYWFFFKIIRYSRLRFALYGMVMFDFILYNAQMIRDPFVCVLLIFVMYYSQLKYTNKGMFVGTSNSKYI